MVQMSPTYLAPRRPLFGRARGVASVVLLAIAMLSTGCGVIGGSRHRHDGLQLVSASESLIVPNRRGPRQITPQSARVLPKPEFGVTPEVQAELTRFMTSDRGSVTRILEENSGRYEATKKVFEGAGVPAELLSVAAVESGFNPQAASPAGARGMWQFMKITDCP